VKASTKESNKQLLERNPLALTVAEAAKLLRLSKPLVYEAIKRKEIPSVRIGARILVPTKQLLQMMDEITIPPR
jgi:excisionase family DNA binding protein